MRFKSIFKIKSNNLFKNFQKKSLARDFEKFVGRVPTSIMHSFASE